MVMQPLSLQSSKLFDITGKVALVTGGGSGLGEMMATSLVQNGAKKVFIASRKEKQLKEVADRLTAAGPGICEYIIADVSTRAGCEALVAEVKKRTPVLHILVNNTGTTYGAPLEDFPEDQGWKRVLATNVQALFYMTAGLAPLLQKEATPLDPGRVVNISSVAGLDRRTEGTGLSTAGVGLWSYNTSKSAANSLTQQMAITLGKRNITVNAILPGVYPSKMTAFGFMNDTENKLAKSHPMGRVGAPEDIAGLLLFLVSRAGAHSSGNLIMTDGGSLLSGGGYANL